MSKTDRHVFVVPFAQGKLRYFSAEATTTTDPRDDGTIGVKGYPDRYSALTGERVPKQLPGLPTTHLVPDTPGARREIAAACDAYTAESKRSYRDRLYGNA